MSAGRTATGKWARRKARRAAVQAVYQWQMAGGSTAEIEAEYSSNGSLDKADADFFREILRGVLLNAGDLDALLAPALDRPVAELDSVERAVLRLAARELSTREDIPFVVVIDEYVELTKLFGAEEGHKFVNGVLDKLASTLRPLEVAAREDRPDVIFACGPMAMLSCVAGIAQGLKVPCQVSVETVMACGMGACLGCAVKGRPGEDRYLHVCRDGPVFEVSAFDWDDGPGA